MDHSQRSSNFVTLTKKMLIGEISNKSELTRDTIRFYAKKGLIKVKTSSSLYNNYKDYSEENLRNLLLIKKAKKFGFTLNEISVLVELTRANNATCSILKGKVTQKLQDIDEKIQTLLDIKSEILKNLQGLRPTCIIKNENCAYLN